MHTKLDSKGTKETVANKSDLKILRAARDMAKHVEINLPEISDAAKLAATTLHEIIMHFDPPTAVAGATQKQAS